MKETGNFIGFLKTTAIGGLIALLPLIVVGALIGQLIPIVKSIAEVLHQFLPAQTPGGIALLVLLAIAILLFLCFAAGLVARKSLGQRITKAFEKKLLLIFPKYAILKDQMADNLGSDENRPQMKPVSVQIHDYLRIGFEIERCDQTRQVVIFLPGSPDAWNGSTVIVPFDRVRPLACNFGDAVGCSEQLGRGSLAILARANGNPDKPPD